MLRPTGAVWIVLLSAVSAFAGQNAPSSGDSGQSLGDVARKVQPKDAKVTTKRVFTDDDVAHGSASSTPLLSLPPSVEATAKDYRESIAELKKWVEDKASQTPRQLSDSVAGETQFPGRDDWERRFFAQKEKLVSVVRDASNSVERMADGGTASERASARIATQKLQADINTQRYLYDQLVTEGVKKAAEWEKQAR